jgi:hypothetical protein
MLDNVESNADVDDEYYCAGAGTYQYQTQFNLPEHSLSDTNFAVNGVTFRIYILVNNDITCNAQFTTIKSQSYTSTEFSLLGVAALVMSGFSAHEIRKRKRRTMAQVDLNAEEHRHGERKRARARRHFFKRYPNEEGCPRRGRQKKITYRFNWLFAFNFYDLWSNFSSGTGISNRWIYPYESRIVGLVKHRDDLF